MGGMRLLVFVKIYTNAKNKMIKTNRRNKMIHIHKWTKWRTNRTEVIEHTNGALIPYSIQEKVCEKCGKMKVEVSKAEWFIKDL